MQNIIPYSWNIILNGLSLLPSPMEWNYGRTLTFTIHSPIPPSFVPMDGAIQSNLQCKTSHNFKSHQHKFISHRFLKWSARALLQNLNETTHLFSRNFINWHFRFNKESYKNSIYDESFLIFAHTLLPSMSELNTAALVIQYPWELFLVIDNLWHYEYHILNSLQLPWRINWSNVWMFINRM